MNPSRRKVLLSAGAAGAAALAIRPGERGAPHDSYFRQLAQSLQQAGVATPTMVIDQARLHSNVKQIVRNINGKMDLRLVVKSLPCSTLVSDIQALTGTRKMMLFSLPQLLLMAAGEAQILLGKPMPVAAAARFYRQHGGHGFNPDQQLQWLIDTPQRLRQYRDLARATGRSLLVNFEIDVGLHRGGIDDLASLNQMLDILQSEPKLRWSGMMGYDAHVAKIPDLPGLQSQAHQHAHQRYTQFAEATLAGLRSRRLAIPDKPCFNAAGSPTYRLYDGSGIENEVSVGSAMLKPSDFDLPALADLMPAAYIATPVLKAGQPFRMPYGVEWIGQLARWWDPNAQQELFIYGGNWLADPVSPTGLSYSGLYGTSSNQQVLLQSGRQQLLPDDQVFFRPRQSEAVLQQFGDIALYRDGKIEQFWPAFPANG